MYKYIVTAITTHTQPSRFSSTTKRRISCISNRGGGANSFGSGVVGGCGALGRIGEDEDDFDETETTEVLTYRERLGSFLHPRDLRKLVTPFTATHEPELIVRRHVVLLNFDTLRAIILRDRLLVLVPNGADSILDDLEKRVWGQNPDKSKQSTSSLHSNQSLSERVPRTGSVKDDTSLFGKRIKNIISSNKSLKGGASNSSTKTISTSTNFVSTESSSTNNSNNPTINDTDDDENETFFEKEWEEIKGEGWIDLPFELKCLDAVLETVSNILTEDTREFLISAFDNIEELHNSRKLNGDGLRNDKDTMIELSSRVQGFSRALNHILDDNENLALMNLSRLLTHPERFIQPVSEIILNEESDEPELILEAHVQEANTLINTLQLLKGKIESMQEELNLRSDAVRNRILYADMLLSVVSLCVGMASLVGSYMGMNVTNHMENDQYAFLNVVLGTSFGTVVILFAIMGCLWGSGALPSISEL